jgi:threonine/homoserine/homoserine lactone efflux protein
MQFNQFTKLSVLCNICFLVTFVNHFYKIMDHNPAWGNVIVLGQIAAVVITIIYFIWVCLFIRKNWLNKEQKILFIIQVLFFMLHIYYNFYFKA